MPAQLILICIGLLEALDRLQERLRLPSSLVKELKRKLAKMADRSLARPVAPPTREKLRHAVRVGDALAESDMWDVAKPEEVHGLVHWLIEGNVWSIAPRRMLQADDGVSGVTRAVTKSVNRLVVAGSLSVCRGIFILIMSLPGVSTVCALLYRIFQLVDDTLGLSASDARDASPGRSHAHQKKLESYMDDPNCAWRGSEWGPLQVVKVLTAAAAACVMAVTAVVLEYREKECMVPMNINRRIQRVMHFQIPLRSFEATVRLPPEHAMQSRRLGQGAGGGAAPPRGDDGASSTSAYVSSSSPRSIPVSPIARKRVQLAFSNFSDDVLYQARDRLRQERAATLTGDRQLRVPRFNIQDCNEEIYLSCGKHCATKVRRGGSTGLDTASTYARGVLDEQVGPGMHRSVRATVPIQKNRYTYFEMAVRQPKSPFRIPGRSSRNLLEASRSKAAAAGGGGGVAGGEPSVCIGLSTRTMPLNTLVGASKYSVRTSNRFSSLGLTPLTLALPLRYPDRLLFGGTRPRRLRAPQFCICARGLRLRRDSWRARQGG